MNQQTLEPEVLDSTIGEILSSEVEAERAETKKADAERPEASPLLVSLAGFLMAAGAAWMMGGVFDGYFANFVGLMGAALGAGLVALSSRSNNSSLIQLAVAPAAMILGAILVAPSTGSGSANLPSLVVEAVTGGGIATPPVPFDPGWRFVLVVIAALTGATAASFGLAFSRPRAALAVAGPLILATALVQPPGAEVVNVVVAFLFAALGLGVAFSAELGRDGALTSEFEIRRFASAGAVMIVIAGAIVGLSQLGALLPPPQEQVVPPKRPEIPPPSKDRLLFTVNTEQLVPLRLGVLDGYFDTAWLTPPGDPNRYFELSDGTIRRGSKLDPRYPAEQKIDAGETFRVTVTVNDLPGRVLPAPAMPLTVNTKADTQISYDPRTQNLRLPGRVPQGITYTVTAPVPPDAARLAAAGDVPESLREFLKLPAPPPAVVQLINEIPPDLPAYERLQFVRTRFYENVVAAGAGDPVDVPPSRLDEMLNGAEASPYEITAGEALLARYAGVPARMGYGYYSTELSDGVLKIHPRHGATWIEVYFAGSGWVPIVGRPPQAKSSLSEDQKNPDPLIKPTEELAVVVHVPVRSTTPLLLYTVVRYWVAKLLPILLLILLLGAAYPWPLKRIRTSRRRRWATARGGAARVAVAYAEFRDAANELGIGHPTDTPIEFLNAVAPDNEHRELAWLVSRAIWGDLSRDLTDDDVETCEAMAASLRRRVVRAQPGLQRLVLIGSRLSLREPYLESIPNIWWKRTPAERLKSTVGRVTRAGRWVTSRLRFRRPRFRTASAIVLIAVALAGAGCIQDVDLTERGSAEVIPAMPEQVRDYTVQREEAGEAGYEAVIDKSLVGHGRLWSIRSEGEVVASFEQAAFKPDLARRPKDTRRETLLAFGGERFRLQKVGEDRVYTLSLPEQRQLLWFSPDGRYYQFMVAKRDLADAENVFATILAIQRGEDPNNLKEPTSFSTPDPRRGIEG